MSDSHSYFMRVALRLAQRAHGQTSPNPMVGAVLVKKGKIIGQGWHHRAGKPHAEIEAIRDAHSKKQNLKGATLYVTLEPCCTHGRTPPCTDAIKAAGIKRVVVAAVDPNPKHASRGLDILREAGIEVIEGVEREKAERLNETFNHWIIHKTPFVTVKAAMTMDGKIATASGESKWITGDKARAYGMKLRQGSDAILVGVNTILADNPSLTIRLEKNIKSRRKAPKALRRIILDPNAKTPITAKVVSDSMAQSTTVVVTRAAPKNRVVALKRKVNVLIAPAKNMKFDLRWLLKKLGQENITSLLVEGGGETNSQFLLGAFAHRVAFFYAPKIIGGRDSRKSVGGEGIQRTADKVSLRDVEWKKVGEDLLLTARVV